MRILRKLVVPTAIVLVALALGGCSGRDKKAGASKTGGKKIGVMSRADSLKLTRLADARQKRKIVLIGLDAASWNLLTPMINRGQLPTLRKLVHEGAYGNLKSVEFFVTPPGWAAMFSGCSPWKTGIYDFGKLNPKTRKLDPVSSLDVKVPMLWDMTSEAGIRTAVINVPVTYPTHPINGIMVSGMLTPNRVFVKKKLVVENPLQPATKKEIRAYGVKSFSQPEKAEVSLYKSHIIAYLLDTVDDEKSAFDKILFVIKDTKSGEKHSGEHSGKVNKTSEYRLSRSSLGKFTPWAMLLLEWEDELTTGWARIQGQVKKPGILEITCTPIYRSFLNKYPGFCYPDSLGDEIAENFEKYIPIASPALVSLIPDFIDDSSGYLQYFFDYDDWDLYIFQIQDTDIIQHLDGDKKYTQDVYMRVDRILGQLMDKLPPNTTVILTSDHGSRLYKFFVNVNYWLDRLGLIAVDSQDKLDHKNSIVYHWGWGIYVNRELLKHNYRKIKGFHPVKRDSLYEHFLDYLIEAGRRIKYPGSNKPMPIVLRRLPKNKVEPAPDLYVEAEYPFYTIHHEDYFKKGQKFIIASFRYERKFLHRRSGIFLFSGEGIRKGEKVGTYDIFDITPTVLYLLGLPVADYFEGKIMDGIFKKDFLAAHPSEHIWSYSMVHGKVPEEKADREKLEEKLRAIGYIE